MKSKRKLAGQRETIRESWTEEERKRRRQLAGVKQQRLGQLLINSSRAAQQPLDQQRSSEVATAC
jgi:hypothetical protein